jgi:hypothetical protein
MLWAFKEIYTWQSSIGQRLRGLWCKTREDCPPIFGLSKSYGGATMPTQRRPPTLIVYGSKVVVMPMNGFLTPAMARNLIFLELRNISDMILPTCDQS